MSKIFAYKEKFQNGDWANALGAVTNEQGKEVVNQAPIGHDWPVYGAIGGIEYPQTGHFDAVGFPPDASPEIKLAYDETVGARDASVLTLAQVVQRIVELEEREKNLGEQAADPSLTDTIRCLKDFLTRGFAAIDNPDETRVVFWFAD